MRCLRHQARRNSGVEHGPHGCGAARVELATAIADGAGVPVKLLALPGSHPCAAVAAMLDAKGVQYDRVDLVPALSRVWLRATGFTGVTVPALRVDATRIQGTRAIARALDARWPDPPLFPSDPAARVRIEQIEAWADGPLQQAARRIVLWSLLRSPVAVRAALHGARLQFRLPTRVAALPVVAAPVLGLDAALNGASSKAVRADLRALPPMLDRIDEWIAGGTLGGSARLRCRLSDRRQRPTAAHCRRPSGDSRRPTRRASRPPPRSQVPRRRAQAGAATRSPAPRRLSPGH